MVADFRDIIYHHLQHQRCSIKGKEGKECKRTTKAAESKARGYLPESQPRESGPVRGPNKYCLGTCEMVCLCPTWRRYCTPAGRRPPALRTLPASLCIPTLPRPPPAAFCPYHSCLPRYKALANYPSSRRFPTLRSPRWLLGLQVCQQRGRQVRFSM
jgi:hypothetical protein